VGERDVSDQAKTQVEWAQGLVEDLRNAADRQQKDAIKIFDGWMPDLTNEELLELASQCGSETTRTHCVYCAAHHALVARQEGVK
jgi:CTP:molybdopterin cytidylyltransferase MocA